MSVHEMLDMTHEFNQFSAGYGFDFGAVAAADMKDCFRHLPCPDGLNMWNALAQYWVQRNVSGVSVPGRSLQSKGVLGRRDDPGWKYCSFDRIGSVFAHLAQTNYMAIDGHLGLELKGVPQGDALSSAFLRLWKWFREYSQGMALSNLDNCVSFPDSRCKLVHFRHANFLALDVSYRDDLRTFAAWNSTSGLNETVLIDWCWKHFLRRFQHGTMVLEEADPGNFVGLKCVWNGSQLALAPQIPDIFAGFCYRLVDSSPLMPWCSWIPPQRESMLFGD